MDRSILLLFLIVVIILFSSLLYADSLYNRMKQGESFYNEEKFDDALNLLVDAQIEAPENIKLKYNIASSHYKMKNYEEAVKGYQDVAATAQDAKVEETALYNIGNAMYRQGKLQEAVEYYKKAIELDLEDKDAQHNLEFVREEIKKKINESKKTEQQQKQQEQKEQKGEGQCDSGLNGEKKENDKQEGEKKDKKEQSPGQDEEKKDENDTQQAAEKEANKEKGGSSEEGSAGQAAQMTKEEAEQWLNSLQENRDKFKKQEKQRKGGSRTRSGNDW